MPYPILYIDHEIHNLNIFKASYKDYYEIHTAFNQAEAVEILKRKPIFLIIAEQNKKDEIGIEYIVSNISADKLPVFIVSTGHLHAPVLEEAQIKGDIFYVLQKPYNELKLTYNLIRGILKYLREKQPYEYCNA